MAALWASRAALRAASASAPDDAEGGVGIGASGFSLVAKRFSIGDGGITNRFGFSNGRVGTGAERCCRLYRGLRSLRP